MPSFAVASPAPVRDSSTELVRREGRHGRVRYDVNLPALPGNPTSAAVALTNALDSALGARVNGAGKLESFVTNGRLLNGEATGVVHVGKGAISAVLITNIYSPGAAHPNNYVNTAVIDRSSGRQISLDDLAKTPSFAAQLSELIHRNKSWPVGEGNHEAKVHGWVATPTGITTYVEVPHPAGDIYPVAVPWPQLRDVVSDRALALLAP